MKKKVVLLGDSIRLIGYGTVLPEMIKDSFDVWQNTDNDRFVQYLLRQIFDNSGEIDGADIVHFNAGQWDVCDVFGDGTFTPVEMYKSCILRVADLLLGKGKTVIFATTTPVRDDNPYNSNENIVRFNEAVVPALREKGVIINDMYALLADGKEKYIREDDKIHLTEEGINLVARKTADLLCSLI